MRIVEEIILLMLDTDEGGVLPSLPRHARDIVIAGAVLTELALENRIDTDPEQLVLADPTPLGDAVLDAALTDIAEESSVRDAAYWLARMSKQSNEILRALLQRLTDAGVLNLDADGNHTPSNLVARARIYPDFDVDVVHTRIMRILFTDEIPSPRDTIIVGLASVAGILERLLSPEEMQYVQGRIETVTRLDLIGRAVINTARDFEPPKPSIVKSIRSYDAIPLAPGLPLLGNAAALLSDLTGFLVRGYREQGPIFRIRIPRREMVVLAGTEANTFMNETGRQHLRSFEAWRGFNDTAGAMRSVLSMDGIEHTRLRKAMAPGYSRKPLQGRLQEVVDITRRGIAEWPDNRAISPLSAMQPIIAEQIGQLLTQCSPRPYLKDLKTFLETLLKTQMTHHWPGFMVHLPRFRRAHAHLMELVADVRSTHNPEARQGMEPDFVDNMLALHRAHPHLLPETDLPLVLLGPYIAGLDTSASACALMLCVLLHNPDLHARVTTEANALFDAGEPTMSALRHLEVTHRVALETLRRYPIAPSLHRTVANPFEFGGFHVPAGKQVLVANSVPHFLPELYPEPECFDIDRFGPERAEHRQPGAYAPFGLGKHRCLGRGFAEVQIIITLATIAYHTELALEHPEQPLRMRYDPTGQPHPSTKFRLVRR